MNYLTIDWSVSIMKIIASIVLVLFAVSVAVAEERLLTAKSPKHRVSLLSLYTSEGCSSCPPADKFLSGLQKNDQLIPLAFHVTYWDYIGWKDPYASPMHDDRQRKIAHIARSRSIYTPQFVLNGSDYRDHASFDENVRETAMQPANVDIILKAEKKDQQAKINIKTDSTKNDIANLAFYLVLYENKLVSHVKDGENEGVILNHDYVVRKVHGPFKQDQSNKTGSFQQIIKFDPQWKKQNMGVVAYAQNLATGEILQAVELELF